MKRTYMTVLLSLIIAGLAFTQETAYENELKLEIELSKPTYILHEPIWLDITFTNNSSDTLRTHGLRFPNHRRFTIDLRDSNGDSVEYISFHWDFAGGPGEILLEVGEQDYGSFSLLESFGLSQWRFPYLPIGSYKVQVFYEGALSSELIFEIVEPSGEEKEVLDLIVEANKLWTQDDTEPSSLLFQKIVDEYPNSVFVERCFYFSLMYSQKIRDDKKQGTYDPRVVDREMLIKYPNAGNSKYWFWAVTRELDADQETAFLNELLELHPNTRFSKYAPQLRKRILREKRGE